MSDRAEGVVSDTGEVIQQQINQVDAAADQVKEFIREYPLAAVMIAAGLGYILGKIT